MVTRKEQPRDAGAIQRARLADIDARTVAFRYYVIEYTPASEDEIGAYVPHKAVKVSPHFDSRDEASVWYDEHVPDPGKTLHICRDRLVQSETWMRG